MPECQLIGPDQHANGCEDQYADPLRENHNANAPNAIDQWPGDKTDEHQRNRSVKSNQCDVKRRVGNLKNEPSHDNHFHPHGLPPEHIAQEQVAKAAIAQRGKGPSKRDDKFSRSSNAHG